MNLPDDLKNYHAEDDPFQLIDRDLAIFLVIVGGVIGYLFRDFM